MCGIRFVIYSAPVFLLLIIKNGDATIDNITMAVDNDISIYYDPATNTTLAIESADASRLPDYPIKLISRDIPCSCNNLKCGCCAGINITLIEFNRLACSNVTFVPEEFALDFYVHIDDEEIMTNRLTARNPPAVCVPLFNLPALIFCVRFFDLHFKENKFNACIDFETRLAQWPIFILHFNCLKFSSDGVTWVKPLTDDGKPYIANITEPEVYDVVNFEISDDESHNLPTSTLTPEEEDQIGTLKI